MKLTPAQLVQQLSIRVEKRFAEDAVQSYIEMQQRFLAGDWKPAELDGGRLCEAIAKAIFQLDTASIDDTKLPGSVIDYLIHQKNAPHLLSATDTIAHFKGNRISLQVSF